MQRVAHLALENLRHLLAQRDHDVYGLQMQVYTLGQQDGQRPEVIGILSNTVTSQTELITHQTGHNQLLESGL